MSHEQGAQNLLYAAVVGLAAWFVPGSGHLILNQKARAAIIFVTITATFVLGLYIGSIGVIDPGSSYLWYVGQTFAGPAVKILGNMNPLIGGLPKYRSFGRPFEIGQIYTTIAGLMNLLCIVSAVYTAHTGKQQPPPGD